MEDSFTATEAAKILKVSARRVRQLAESGRLLVVQESPLRVSQLSVTALKEIRSEQPKQPAKKPAASSNKQPSLSELVEALNQARNSGIAEARAALELVATEQRERAERAEQRAAEAELALRVSESTAAALKAQLDTLQSKRKKFGLF